MFEGCCGIASLDVENGNSVYDSREDCDAIIETATNRIVAGCKNTTIPGSVTTIGNYAFSGCSSLSSISIPNSVTTIGTSAFKGCSGLKSISIPEGVTSIGDFAFSGCIDLSSVTIPNGVVAIERMTFQDCSNITSVTIPNSVVVIGENAFSNSGLTFVFIPSSVVSIKSQAFSNCQGVTAVYCNPEGVPQTNSYAFYKTPIGSATLYVPTNSLNAYKAVEPWSGFGSITDAVYYKLSITTGIHGKATYSGKDIINDKIIFNVKEGNDVTITITPDEGYIIKTVTVDGVDKTAEVSTGTLTFSNMTDNKTVVVNFVIDANMTTVNIGSAGMASFCPSHDLDFSEVEGLSAYIGAGFNTKSGKLSMLQVTDVPAGTGLFLVGKAGSYDVPQLASSSIFANLLCGVASATTIAPTDGGYTNYILSDGPNGVGFYKVSESGELAAGKAYLRLPTPTAGARKMISIDVNDNTTGISELTDDDAELAAWFDLQGCRYDSKPTRAGFYIRNGRVAIVK